MGSSTKSAPKSKERSRPPGSSLGFKTADVKAVAPVLAKGLKYGALERFQKRSGLSLEAIGTVTKIPARTRARRKLEGKLSAHESERLYRLAIVFDKALQLFEGNATATLNWLNAPSTALGNATPLKMTETEIGAREVENLIGRLEHGVLT